MSKKISKILLALLLTIVTISSLSISFADEAVVTSQTDDQTTTTTAEEEIYNGDLYLFDNNIVMDKLVDGNVFIFGSDVQVTGQVNGNLFVFANTVSFNESYVRYSIFVCANSVYYNGACNDLYVATTNLEMTYDSYVVRDVKAIGSDVVLKAAVGRDVDLLCSNVNFGEGETIPLIYGSLRYSADKEVGIPEEVISGDGTITYTKPSELDNAASSISNILIGFATCIVTVLVIYVLIKKITPNFNKKLSQVKLSVLDLIKAFGLGLASLILVSIIFVLLLITSIGAKLGTILILLYAALCLIAVPTLAIIITNMLKPAFKVEKASMFCLILSLVNVILYGITLLPFVGVFLAFVIKMIAIGALIDIYLPHKELTDEEKATIAEAKKQAKELKDQKKQEKIKIKADRKQEKLETKKSKNEKNK